MMRIPEAVPIPRGEALVPAVDRSRPKFGKNNDFQVELQRRVDEFFRITGRWRRDCPQMYLKTFILLTGFATTYLLLVFAAQTWWQAVPLSIMLGLLTAGIGFNVQHDGGHHAYSNLPWVNKLMSLTLDLVGGSSYFWYWKHVAFHHTYVNIDGADTDIEMGLLGRLSPHQKHYGFHRFQQFYLWPLYGFVAIKWQLYDNFREAITGCVGDHPVPRPKGWELATFVGCKALFFTLAFGIPLAFHSVWIVLFYYTVVVLVLGMVLSVVFQLAHAVEEAEFPQPERETGRIENSWAIHQTETTVNFARRSPIVTWLLGGLNFQIEHHLFPRICHVNYPAISKVVEATCREYGVKYSEHRTFWAGLASHFRWLRRMGRPDAA